MSGKMYKFNVNKKDSDGNTAAHRAAVKGLVKDLKHCVSLGADLTILNNKGLAVIHQAAANNQVGVIRYLASIGADLNARDAKGNTPVHYAIVNAKIEAIDALVELGVDITIRNDDNVTASFMIIAHEKAKEMIGCLSKVKGGINAIGNIREIWSSVVGSGKIEIIKALIGAKININIRSNGGNTGLHFAALGENVEVFKVLVEAGCDLTALNNDGFASAHIVPDDRVGIIEYLASIQGALDIKTKDGFTVLHMAALQNKVVVINALGAARVDFNSPTNNGSTALHLVSGKGQDEVVKALVRGGADVNATVNGVSAMDFAKQAGHQIIVEILRAAGAKEALKDKTFAEIAIASFIEVMSNTFAYPTCNTAIAAAAIGVISVCYSGQFQDLIHNTTSTALASCNKVMTTVLQGVCILAKAQVNENIVKVNGISSSAVIKDELWKDIVAVKPNDGIYKPYGERTFINVCESREVVMRGF